MRTTQSSELMPDPALVIALVIAALVWFLLTNSVNGIIITMIIVTVSLVIWFLQYKAAGSERRLMRMMEYTGLPQDIAANEKTAGAIEAARRRCRRCQAEGLCERWLEGEVTGENAFCPNAALFRQLATGSAQK